MQANQNPQNQQQRITQASSCNKQRSYDVKHFLAHNVTFQNLQSNPYWWLVVQVVVPNNNIYSNIYLNLSDEASLSPDRELFFSIFINLESNKCTVINNLSTEPRRWQRILIIFLWALNIKATFIRSRVIIETNISPPQFSKITLCTQHRFKKSCCLHQNA